MGVCQNIPRLKKTMRNNIKDNNTYYYKFHKNVRTSIPSGYVNNQEMKSNYLESDVTSRTFLTGRKHNIAVVSMSSNPANFYGGSGLFKNITKKKPVKFFGSSLMKAARLLGLILGITLLILLILAIRIAHINRVNKKRKDERRKKRLEIRERERREQEESYQRDRDHRTNRDHHMK